MEHTARVELASLMGCNHLRSLSATCALNWPAWRDSNPQLSQATRSKRVPFPFGSDRFAVVCFRFKPFGSGIPVTLYSNRDLCILIGGRCGIRTHVPLRTHSLAGKPYYPLSQSSNIWGDRWVLTPHSLVHSQSDRTAILRSPLVPPRRRFAHFTHIRECFHSETPAVFEIICMFSSTSRCANILLPTKEKGHCLSTVPFVICWILRSYLDPRSSFTKGGCRFKWAIITAHL